MATIDLSQLPAPDVVEVLDYETLLAERKATLISLYPAEQQATIARTLALESEPIVKLLQENAYREVILRQRVNEAAQANMVAYANDGDLDQLGANNGVTRLTLVPADDTTIPPTPAVMESNDDFRLRVASAFEGLSVADLLAVVDAALNDEDVRPVADRVTVQSASIVNYAVEAVLYLYPGPEAEPVRAAAEKKLAAFVSAQARLGRDIRKSALYAALHVEGVQRVELAQPAADVVLDKTQAAYCTGYSITVGGSDE